MMTAREFFAYAVGWYFSGVLSRSHHQASTKEPQRLEPTVQPDGGSARAEASRLAEQKETQEAQAAQKKLRTQTRVKQSAELSERKRISPEPSPLQTRVSGEEIEPMSESISKNETAQSKTPHCIVDGGNIKAHSWENQGKNGDYYTMTFLRTYTDRESGSEKTTHSFRPQDIERLIAVAEKAREYIATLSKSRDESPEEIRITR
jgi:hypothetical protein